jgi:hypothetical protein
VALQNSASLRNVTVISNGPRLDLFFTETTRERLPLSFYDSYSYSGFSPSGGPFRLATNVKRISLTRNNLTRIATSTGKLFMFCFISRARTHSGVDKDEKNFEHKNSRLEF